MVQSNEFKVQLFNVLQAFDYALITDIPLSKYLSTTGMVYDILIAKEQLLAVVDAVKTIEAIDSCSLSKGNNGSYINLQMSNGEWIIVNLIVKLLTNDQLVLINEKQVLKRRLLSHQGMFVLSIEDHFELATLNSFLNYKGWSDRTVAYFDEFHFLIKEDLVESFNLRYETSFVDIYSMIIYDDGIRTQLWNKVKAQQPNEDQSSSGRWSNFLDAVRQARF